MIFNTQNHDEAKAAWEFLTKLIRGGKPVEINQLRKSSSKKQKSYLHVIIAELGEFLGYTLEEMKKQVKRSCYPTYKKNGITFIKETRDLDTKEMTEVIRRFQQWAAEEFDYYIPDPTIGDTDEQ